MQVIQKYVLDYIDGQLLDDVFLCIELKCFGVDVLQLVFLNVGIGVLQFVLFEEMVEVQLWELMFIIDYLVEVLLFVCVLDMVLGIIECFELFMIGCEIVNGFLELNDLEDQVVCFKKQVEQKDVGDEEVMFFDVDYICVFEYGMFLIGGCGIGIDCFVMLLIDSLMICDVLLFLYLCCED